MILIVAQIAIVAKRERNKSRKFLSGMTTIFRRTPSEMFEVMLLLLSSTLESYQHNLFDVYFVEKHNIEPNTTATYFMRNTKTSILTNKTESITWPSAIPFANNNPLCNCLLSILKFMIQCMDDIGSEIENSYANRTWIRNRRKMSFEFRSQVNVECLMLNMENVPFSSGESSRLLLLYQIKRYSKWGENKYWINEKLLLCARIESN